MPQRIMRALLTRVGLRQTKPARGFTIVEVMVAFAVVLIVLIGLTSALTASMRLNTVQKQRALAQDIVRDVVSTYVKNAPYEDINPFDIQDDGTCTDCSNVTQVVYDASNGTDNIASYTGLPSLLAGELASLQQPKLELLISPVKKTATEFYATKINVLARLSWDGGGQRVIEMPSVVGMGDLTRTDRARFEKPGPTPTPPAGLACAVIGDDPDVVGFACCTGFVVDENGKCAAPSAENPSCAPPGQDPTEPSYNGTCCMGEVDGADLCETGIPSGPVCAPEGQNPSGTDYDGTCCTGLNLKSSTGTCENCKPASASCPGNNECKTQCCSGSGANLGGGNGWACT